VPYLGIVWRRVGVGIAFVFVLLCFPLHLPPTIPFHPHPSLISILIPNTHLIAGGIFAVAAVAAVVAVAAVEGLRGDGNMSNLGESSECKFTT